MATWTTYQFPSNDNRTAVNPVAYLRRKSLEYLEKRREKETNRIQNQTRERIVETERGNENRKELSLPPPSPLPTFLHSMIEVNQNLIIYGGATEKGEANSAISVFDASTLSYGVPEEEVKLTEESGGPRYGHSATLITSHPATLLIFGGMIGGNTFSFGGKGVIGFGHGETNLRKNGKNLNNYSSNFDSVFGLEDDEENKENGEGEEVLEFESYLDLDDNKRKVKKEEEETNYNGINNSNNVDLSDGDSLENTTTNNSKNDNNNKSNNNNNNNNNKRHEPIRRLSDCNVNYDPERIRNKEKEDLKEGNSIIYGGNKVQIRSSMAVFRQGPSSSSFSSDKVINDQQKLQRLQRQQQQPHSNNGGGRRRGSLQEQLSSLKTNVSNYIGGGYNKSSGFNESLSTEEPDNDIYLLECSSQSWQWSKPLVKVAPGHCRPSSRSEHTATKINANEILYFAGWCESPLNDLHLFNIGKMEWSQPTIYGQKQKSKEYYSNISSSSSFSPLGNNNKNNSNYTSWMSNDIIVQGTKISTGSPSPRYRHTAVQMGNRVLIFGGSDNGEDVAEYSEADDMNALWALNLPLSNIELQHSEQHQQKSDSKENTEQEEEQEQEEGKVNRREIKGIEKRGGERETETVIDTENQNLYCSYSWSKLVTQGYSPLPRSGHSASPLSATTIALFGGKKNNVEGTPFSSELFLLDIERLEDKEGEEEQQRQAEERKENEEEEGGGQASNNDNKKNKRKSTKEKDNSDSGLQMEQYEVESKSNIVNNYNTSKYYEKKYNLYQDKKYIFRWTQVKTQGQIPRGLTGTTMTTIDNKLYVFGGADFRHKCYNEIHVVEFKHLFPTVGSGAVANHNKSDNNYNDNGNENRLLFGQNSSTLIHSRSNSLGIQEEKKDQEEIIDTGKGNDIIHNSNISNTSENLVNFLQPEMMKIAMTFKIIVIGDSGVGKSSLLYRYTANTFDLHYTSTLGIDFNSKIITIPDNHNHNNHNSSNNNNITTKRVKLEIWDTAGQERFSGITQNYYRGAQGALLVYDVTNRESFENIEKWVDRLQRYGGPEMDIILVGNKIDLVAKEDEEEIENEIEKENQNKENNGNYENNENKKQLDIFQIESFSDDDDDDKSQSSLTSSSSSFSSSPNIDTKTRRKVSYGEGQRLALKLSSTTTTKTAVQFIETSAKLSLNVNEAFNDMATFIDKRLLPLSLSG